MMFHSPGRIFSITPGVESDSLSTILRRVADPVKSFGFKFVQHGLAPPLLDSIRDRSGKEPGLFGQFDDGQANEFQYVHGRKQLFFPNSPAVTATRQTSEPVCSTAAPLVLLPGEHSPRREKGFRSAFTPG